MSQVRPTAADPDGTGWDGRREVCQQCMQHNNNRQHGWIGVGQQQLLRMTLAGLELGQEYQYNNYKITVGRACGESHCNST